MISVVKGEKQYDMLNMDKSRENISEIRLPICRYFNLRFKDSSCNKYKMEEWGNGSFTQMNQPGRFSSSIWTYIYVYIIQALLINCNAWLGELK